MGSAWMRAFADMMRSAPISEIHAVLLPADGMFAASSPGNSARPVSGSNRYPTPIPCIFEGGLV
jgi:hypothetical protein